MREPIEVLLAVYRGGAHLREQLASLAAQRGAAWELLVRDEGGEDGALLAEFAAAHPGRVRLLDGGLRLGAAGNFAALLAASTRPHVACCDQDDVWHPLRLAAGERLLRQAEAEGGAATPLLVHSDLAVTGPALEPIAPSFWALQGLEPRGGARLARMLVQNVVTGCSVLMNRALLDRALPLPSQAIMHDWWLALVAAACGRLLHLPAAALRYRQHGGNQLGAVDAATWTRRSLARREGLLPRYAAQAASLLERLAGRMPRERERLVRRFLRICAQPWPERAALLARAGHWKHGHLRLPAWLAGC